MSNTISSQDNRKPVSDNTGLLDALRGTPASVLVPGLLLTGAFICACMGVILLVRPHVLSLISAVAAPYRPIVIVLLATIPTLMALIVTGLLCGGRMRDTRIAILVIGIAFSLTAVGVAVSYLII